MSNEGQVTIWRIVGVDDEWWEVKGEANLVLIGLLNLIGVCQKKGPIKLNNEEGGK